MGNCLNAPEIIPVHSGMEHTPFFYSFLQGPSGADFSQEVFHLSSALQLVSDTNTIILNNE